MIKSDNFIRVLKVRSKNDYRFVESCINAIDFNLYIHDSLTSPDKYRILKKEDRYLGIFNEKFSYVRGVRIYSPNLYVKNKFSSIFCISSMIQWIYKHKRWDKISFVVYSNNKACLAVMSRLGIHLDGILRNTNYELMYDTYLFSILPNEIEDLKCRYNSLLRL